MYSKLTEPATAPMKAPFFIGIAGGTASGKSALAAALARRCDGAATVISLDEFYLPLAAGEDGRTHDWDDRSSIDWDEVLSALRGWKAGFAQKIPQHDFSSYTRTDKAKCVEPAPVMIFEGIHMLGNEEVRGMMGLMVFVKCDIDTTLARRIRRDISERGYDVGLVLERWDRFVKPAFVKQIAPTERYAAISIPNDIDRATGAETIGSHPGVDVIMAVIREKLK